MQAQHHHKSAARVKVYHGRCHTKKQKNNLLPKQLGTVKKEQKKKKKAAQTHRSKIVFRHYQHFEKPKSPCVINASSQKQVDIVCGQRKKSHKLDGSKTSPKGGGLEGALEGPTIGGLHP